MKKIHVLAVSAGVSLLLSGCGPQISKPTVKVDRSPGAVVEEELAERFISCKTLEEAEEKAGFAITLPSDLGGYEPRTYKAIANEILEVNCEDADGNALIIRLGPGQDDISGDMDKYSAFDFVIVAEQSIFERIDYTGIRVATWTTGTWTYSLKAEKGFSPDFMERMVETMTEQ